MTAAGMGVLGGDPGRVADPARDESFVAGTTPASGFGATAAGRDEDTIPSSKSKCV